MKQWLGEVRSNTNYHLLGAYYVAGPHHAEQFTHITSTRPPAHPRFMDEETKAERG